MKHKKQLNDRTKILYHVAASEEGGAVFSFYELIKNLDLNLYDPFVLITLNECKEFVAQIENYGVTPINLNIKINAWIEFNSLDSKNKNIYIRLKGIGRFIRHITNSLKIAYVIKKNNISIVHTNDENLIDAALGSLIANCKHVWHIRSRIGNDGWVNHLLGRKFIINTINLLSNRIIVNSESSVEPWILNKKTNKTILIHNGVDINKFNVNSGSLRNSKNIDNATIITMISTNPVFDGLDYFINASGFVNRFVENVYFFMIGDINSCNQEFIRKQKNKIIELGLKDKFFFKGFRTDIPNVLFDTDILVEPMQNGAWSRVILEAMAVGVPVIGVDENQKSDFIENGVTGILVRNQNEIGEALLLLVKDIEQRTLIKNNALLRVNSCFTSQKYAQNIMSVYMHLNK